MARASDKASVVVTAFFAKHGVVSTKCMYYDCCYNSDSYPETKNRYNSLQRTLLGL
jgi:hypothetical protein